MEKIRVLVVDDSLFMRTLIKEMLESDDRIEVVGTAKDGYEAIEKTQFLKPDVITLDVEMPRMNGLEALAYIMSEIPTPVIMLSAITRKGTSATIKAFEYGAFDFVSKPSGNISLNIKEIEDELLEKIIAASKTDTSKLKIILPEEKPKTPPPLPTSIKFKEKIVAIGASTGGPKALTQILTRLPSPMHAAIIVVQHMPPGFTASFAHRLNHLCKVPVKEAENEEIIKAGMVYIAPGGYHLKIEYIDEEYKAILDDETPPVFGVRPSVDVMMRTVANNFDKGIMSIILTGMGKDGARGMELLKEKNAITIVQDKHSAVVYGMPSSAIARGCVDKILPLDEITHELTRFILN